MNSNKLFDIFKQKKIDAIISESAQTRKWYTGLDTTEGLLIIQPKKATLFVDGRYIEYAKKNSKNVTIELLKSDSLQKWFAKNNKVEIIGLEEDYLVVSKKDHIKQSLKLKNSSIIKINAQELRIIKSKEEIDKIQKAIDISLESYEILKPFLKEGVTEKEIQNKLEYIMVGKGADKEAFDSIVAFGESTAEPHHHSSNRKLKNGDMVTIDFGAKYDGYCADITRTFIFHDQGNEKYKEILSIVEEAAKLGREAVKPGIKASEIDKICRSYIEKKGYSKFFLHSTGHGLGIDVHELPYVSTKSNIVLEEGMVITVEPGIYIEGIGGARIEDDVLVTSTGAKVLSRK